MGTSPEVSAPHDINTAPSSKLAKWLELRAEVHVQVQILSFEERENQFQIR